MICRGWRDALPSSPVKVAVIGFSSWLQLLYFVIVVLMIVLALRLPAGEQAT